MDIATAFAIGALLLAGAVLMWLNSRRSRHQTELDAPPTPERVPSSEDSQPLVDHSSVSGPMALQPTHAPENNSPSEAQIFVEPVDQTFASNQEPAPRTFHEPALVAQTLDDRPTQDGLILAPTEAVAAASALAAPEVAAALAVPVSHQDAYDGTLDPPLQAEAASVSDSSSVIEAPVTSTGDEGHSNPSNENGKGWATGITDHLPEERASLASDDKTSELPLQVEVPSREESSRSAHAKGRAEVTREPADYRAPRRVPPRNRPTRQVSEGSFDRQHPFEIRVNAQLDRYGFCAFRLLAQRPADCPSELQVQQREDNVTFVESGEGWYEIDAGTALAAWLSGVLFRQADGEKQHRWQLSNRAVHVLAAQQGFAGPTSTTRITLQRRHIVLCRSAWVDPVVQVLAESQSDPFSVFSEDMGAPTGWKFLWPVSPTHPVEPVLGDDILNLLRPQADVELTLEHGIRIHDSVWLAGYPPDIRLSGVLNGAEAVHIDAQLAVQDAEGFFATAGHARPGTHIVSCAGQTRTYSIDEPDAEWERWDAYSFPRGTICGASFLSPLKAEQRLITVPATSRVLVGTEPGQVFFCQLTRGTDWTGLVPFDPVWALPSDPLHCDRGKARVVLLNASLVQGGRQPLSGRCSIELHRQWTQAITDCCRKRLQMSPSDERTLSLWRDYAALARSSWKRRQ